MPESTALAPFHPEQSRFPYNEAKDWFQLPANNLHSLLMEWRIDDFHRAASWAPKLTSIYRDWLNNQEHDPLQQNRTPLIAAVQARNTHAIDLLASVVWPSGALTDCYGRDALTYAILSGNVPVVTFLCEYHSNLGINFNVVGFDGLTCLMQAVLVGSREILTLLLGHAASKYLLLIDTVDSLGSTALMLAVRSRRVDMAQLLLVSRCRVNIVDHEGFSAFMYAAQTGQVDMVQLFFDFNSEHKALAHHVSPDDQLVNIAQQNPRTGETAATLALANHHDDIYNMIVARLQREELPQLEKQRHGIVSILAACGRLPVQDWRQSTLQVPQIPCPSPCPLSPTSDDEQ